MIECFEVEELGTISPSKDYKKSRAVRFDLEEHKQIWHMEINQPTVAFVISRLMV